MTEKKKKPMTVPEKNIGSTCQGIFSLVTLCFKYFFRNITL